MVGGNFTSASWLVQQLAEPIGYGLVGWAWWQWIRVPRTDPAGATAVRRSSRTLALASAVTSLAFFAFLYGNLRFRYAFPQHSSFFIPHWNLHNDGYAASGIGFVLASVGFWIAASSVPASESNTNPDLVEATP
jgi:hypothetical protein